MSIPKFETFTSGAVPVEVENIDTDQIIPARFLKATERKGFGEERYEKLELQKKVNETFHKLKEQDKGRKWVVIDGSKPLDEVSRDIDAALRELVAERK